KNEPESRSRRPSVTCSSPSLRFLSRASASGWTSLKFPAPVLRPALGDHLLIGIELDGVLALRVKVSKETGLPPADRKVGHRRRYSDIHPDVTRAHLVPKLPRRSTVRGKNRSGIPVVGGADDIEGLVQAPGVHQAQNRAEDLGGHQLRAAVDAGQHGRADE